MREVPTRLDCRFDGAGAASGTEEAVSVAWLAEAQAVDGDLARDRCITLRAWLIERIDHPWLRCAHVAQPEVAAGRERNSWQLGLSEEAEGRGRDNPEWRSGHGGRGGWGG